MVGPLSAPANPFDALVEFFDDVRATPTHRRLVARVYEAVAAAPVGMHLDVGCGTGALCELSVAVGRPVTGTDVSAAMCFRAHRRTPGASFAVAAFESLPVADGGAAALTAMLVLHLCDGPRALAEAARALRPGGVIAVVTQSDAWDEATARDYVARRGIEGIEREFCVGSARSGEGGRRYEVSELRTALHAAGFVDARIEADLDGGMLIASARRG